MKSIFFIVPSMTGGGAERVISTLLNHIDRVQFKPTLVLLQKHGAYLSDIPKDIEIIDLNAKKARYGIFFILQLLWKRKPDIVLSTLGYLNVLISLFIPLMPSNTLFIARESNTVSVKNKLEKYPFLFDFLYKKFYSNYDVIVSQSEYMKKDLIENYEVAPAKIEVINNPIDIEKVSQMACSPQKKFFDDEKIKLIAVGRLNYQKGFDILLECMTKLDDSFQLIILGAGPDEDKLKKLKNVLLLNDKKVIFAGFQTNPYAYMQQADIFILSSRYEGFPNVVLEANLCGLPVIAFDTPGGTSEIIEENLNGLLVNKKDPDALAQAIKDMNLSQYNKEKIKNNIINKYGTEIIVKKYEELFLNISKQS